jgi:nitroreductase
MKPIPQDARDQMFTKARTYHGWSSRPVEDGRLQEIYDLLKWCPTSVNGSPGRFVFLRPGPGREPLLAALMDKNVEQTRTAPITAIVAYDLEWLEQLGKLSPNVDYRPHFSGKSGLIEATAFRNSSLQGAYFMLAARALGLDCGPMSGFDNAAIDEAYFRGTPWRSNFLCNLGYGDATSLYPRAPRLSFEEACRLL